jgi:hypothetical protein
MDSVVGPVTQKAIKTQVGAARRLSVRPSGALEITPAGTRFIRFDDHRAMGIALALARVHHGRGGGIEKARTLTFGEPRLIHHAPAKIRPRDRDGVGMARNHW